MRRNAWVAFLIVMTVAVGLIVGCTTAAPPPLQLSISGEAVTIAAALTHTVGLRADGTVVAVGSNEY